MNAVNNKEHAFNIKLNIVLCSLTNEIGLIHQHIRVNSVTNHSQQQKNSITTLGLTPKMGWCYVLIILPRKPHHVGIRMHVMCQYAVHKSYEKQRYFTIKPIVKMLR